MQQEKERGNTHNHDHDDNVGKHMEDKNSDYNSEATTTKTWWCHDNEANEKQVQQKRAELGTHLNAVKKITARAGQDRRLPQDDPEDAAGGLRRDDVVAWLVCGTGRARTQATAPASSTTPWTGLRR